MGLLGSELLDKLLLQLFLSNPGTATKNSSETYHLNHLFGSVNVLSATFLGYDGISSVTSLNDICGTIWFSNVPPSEGLESVDGVETMKNDVLEALTHPSLVYSSDNKNIPKDSNNQDYTGYANANFLDFSSAAPILFGASVLNSLPSSFPNITKSDYWLASGSNTTNDGKTNYTKADLMYPALDFSTIHDIANYTLAATNGSAIDGSGLGVNVTNVSHLITAGVKPFQHPDDKAANTKFGSGNKSNFAALLNMISDISAISKDSNGTTIISNYTAYPNIFVSQGVGRTAQGTVKDMSGSGIAQGALFDASSTATASQKLAATTTNYLKPMTSNLAKVNTMVENVTWDDIYDVSGFGLNVLAYKEVGDLTSQLNTAVANEDPAATNRFQSDYTYTTTYNTTTGKQIKEVSTYGHPVNYGLLDKAMNTATLEVAPYVDNSQSLLSGKALDFSNSIVYLRLLKLQELGVVPDTFLYWRRNPNGITQNSGTAYTTDLSSNRYNFVNSALRDISAHLVTGLNGGGFYGTDNSNNPGDIPWEYTPAMTAVYGEDFFGTLAIYDIVTRMSNDEATWTQAFDRLDISLNNTGKSNQQLPYVNANQLVYNSSTSTCKASKISELFDSIYLFAGVDQDEDTQGQYDGYVKYYKEISASNVWPSGVSATKDTTVASIGANNTSTTGDNKSYATWVDYQDISDARTSVYGGEVAEGLMPMYTSDAVKKYRLQEQLVDSQTKQLANYAQCDGVTANDVQKMINAAAGRFIQIPYTSLVNSYAEASNLLVAVECVTTASCPADLANQFSLTDMSMCLLKECYKAVFPEATELQLVNKILLDQYSSDATSVNDINNTIDQLLDCNVSMDTILSANVGKWNNHQQIGDTVGIYATGETTTIVRAHGIATAFASKPELSYAFFDDMSSGILDMSGLTPTPYSTAPTGASLTTVTNQQKADMVDFMLFFGVDQEVIYNMMGANDHTRTYWVKNWLENTRQKSYGQSDLSGANFSSMANYGTASGLYNNSALPVSPLAFVADAATLIRKVPIGELINDSRFGLTYAGWAATRGEFPSWVLAYKPHELKAAGIPCDAVILSAITTGFVIDPHTLALEGTNKCAFSSYELKKSGTGPNGESQPGYTQPEIDAAVGSI